MVLKQCQVLVDLSPDITTWNNSKYGISLRLSSTHSLSMIRKHWKLYIGTMEFSEAEMDSLRAEFRMGYASEVNMTSIRAAGPLWTELNDMGSQQFDRYRKTGVTFEERDKVTKANEINPTFAYSAKGKGFSLHYGSDPIVSFHLAKTLGPISGTRSNKTVTTSDLVKGAMEEFKRWCLAFSRRIKKQQAPLVIRFLVGDAIAACRALHYCTVNGSVDPGLYTAPWSPALMKLDGGDYEQGASYRAPLQFNVIDTSNLTDHIGLFNILIPCRPLMQTRSSSVIFTDTLLPLNDENTTTRDGFLELLCGDLSVLSMILDLIPVSYPSNFTTHSNVHEIMALAVNTYVGDRKQFHEHNAWRIGTLSDSMVIRKDAQLDQRMKFDELQLATFLYGVYMKMFSDENVDDISQSPLIMLEKHSILHYSRFTLAYLSRFVKDRVDVNWEDVMNYLHDLISRDRKLHMGTNNLQDLFCSLHLLDVYSFYAFRPIIYADVKKGPLKRWKNVPPVICISLKVPRKSFDILSAAAKEIGSPYLDCSLIGPAALNLFLQYQCFWGKLKAEYSKDSSQEPKVTFEEDAEGFRGTSPAIFTFYIPSWFLNVDATHRVAVSVRSNLITVMKLEPVLGPSMDLFSAELTDRRYVHITRERPGNPGELQKLRRVSFALPTSQETRSFHNPVKVTLDSAARQVALLTGRANIEDAKVKASLANGAAVSIRQISPRAMQISIGNHLQTIIYPFPINSSDSKTRIARKSSYVEVRTCVDILQIDSKFLTGRR